MHLLRPLRRIFILLAGAGFFVPMAAADLDEDLLERARSGDAGAQLEAGYFLYVNGEPERGAFWFAAAARQGNPAAQYNLGRCYLTGIGTVFDEHLAKEWFEKAAPKLPAAKLALARLIQKGLAADPDTVPPREAVAPDESAALQLYRELAAIGVAEAQYEAARILLVKNAKPEAIQEGTAYLEKAAEAHLAAAELLLADFTLQGKFVPLDEVRARALLERAAQAGLVEAKVKYAFALEHGWGAPPEPEKARVIYEEVLAEEYVMPAAVRLAGFLLTGRGGAQQDVQRAFLLYQKAAESGAPEALTQLGVCYRDGLGTTPDAEKAFQLFFAAARADYAPAAYHVAKAFASGSGTPQDEEAAFYWFEQAAMRGDPRGLLEAGRRALEGCGTEPDPGKALLYLGAAAQNGMNEALPFLEKARQRQSNLPEAEETPRIEFRRR